MTAATVLSLLFQAREGFADAIKRAHLRVTGSYGLVVKSCYP